MISSMRWIDRSALAVGIGFLIAAAALGLLWCDPAGAAPPRVRTERASHLIYRAEVRAFRRFDTRAHAFRIRCGFDDVRGHGARRTGVITDCTFRAYRHSNYRGLLSVMPFRAHTTHRLPAGLGPDGDGAVTYSASRSVVLEVMPRSQ